MKYFFGILYMCMLLILNKLHAQALPQLHAGEPIIAANYTCNNAQNYIPYQPQYSPLKHLRLAIHVFGKDDGTANLQPVAEHQAFLVSIINHLNWMYTEPDPQKPASPMYRHIPDSRLRFVADTVFFHRNTDAWDFKKYVGRYDEVKKDTVYSNSGGYNRAEQLYRQYVEENQRLSIKHKDSALHIFLFEAYNFQNRGMAENIRSKRWVYSIGAFHHFNSGKNHWDPALLLAHEIAHALGLYHPYDIEQCDDLPLSRKGETNNIVDSYPNQGSGITPCQLGILHYNLSGKAGPLGNIVMREYYRYKPDSLIRIPAGDTVFFNGEKHFPADVYIEKGAVLVVKCNVYMPQGASIYVEKGGTLIVNGGALTSLHAQPWKGVKLEKRNTILGIFKRRTQAALHILNDGKILHAEKAVMQTRFE